jgi:molybdenum cofactor synthesis domain-containing protein
MKSSILGVGTELTDGQILNRNATWISSRLKPLGARTSLHLVVPDDRALILEALDTCAKHSDIIFVTGGLGPTSDDFTRDLISQWSGQPLEFHEPSWTAVIERLTSRGYQVQEFQRQQCSFPRGSKILLNSQGTANGFRLRAKNRELVVLPGPPREIEAIWNDHLQAWLADLCQSLDAPVTHSWDTIGLGESQIATMTEPLIAGSDLEAGYRVHLPYVEFKVTHPKSKSAKYQKVLEDLEQTLACCTVARDGGDVASDLALVLKKYANIQVIDEISGGILLKRINEPFKELWATAKWSVTSAGEPDATSLCLRLRPVAEDQIKVSLIKEGKEQETLLEAPMKAALMSERRKQYFVEIALTEWKKFLG